MEPIREVFLPWIRHCNIWDVKCFLENVSNISYKLNKATTVCWMFSKSPTSVLIFFLALLCLHSSSLPTLLSKNITKNSGELNENSIRKLLRIFGVTNLLNEISRHVYVRSKNIFETQQFSRGAGFYLFRWERYIRRLKIFIVKKYCEKRA